MLSFKSEMGPMLQVFVAILGTKDVTREFVGVMEGLGKGEEFWGAIKEIAVERAQQNAPEPCSN